MLFFEKLISSRTTAGMIIWFLVSFSPLIWHPSSWSLNFLGDIMTFDITVRVLSSEASVFWVFFLHYSTVFCSFILQYKYSTVRTVRHQLTPQLRVLVFQKRLKTTPPINPVPDFFLLVSMILYNRRYWMTISHSVSGFPFSVLSVPSGRFFGNFVGDF